jgi:hypothetical protein
MTAVSDTESEAARAAWPGVDVARAHFESYVHERTAATASPQFPRTVRPMGLERDDGRPISISPAHTRVATTRPSQPSSEAMFAEINVVVHGCRATKLLPSTKFLSSCVTNSSLPNLERSRRSLDTPGAEIFGGGFALPSVGSPSTCKRVKSRNSVRGSPPRSFSASEIRRRSIFPRSRTNRVSDRFPPSLRAPLVAGAVALALRLR